MIAWAHHAALNLGAALAALWWAALPPHPFHDAAQVRDLGRGSGWRWFVFGLGVADDPAVSPRRSAGVGP